MNGEPLSEQDGRETKILSAFLRKSARSGKLGLASKETCSEEERARSVPPSVVEPVLPSNETQVASDEGRPVELSREVEEYDDSPPLPMPEPTVSDAPPIPPIEPVRGIRSSMESFFPDEDDSIDSVKERPVSRPSSTKDLVVVSDLHKGYVKGKVNIPVLRGVNFSVAQGEYLSIVGQSGSGKSTLLHLMGTLDIPDQGTIHFDGQRIDNLPHRQRDMLRNHYIGMIFQFYHLIPEMTMIENVLSPLMIRESAFDYFRHRRAYRARAKELLEMVGLGHRIRHKPNELSGGEMQRTAIARALITEPRILLADEPTGNLDSKTSVEIVKILRSLNLERQLTIIMVTHDTAQAEEADRYIRLVDGQIAEVVQKRER